MEFEDLGALAKHIEKVAKHVNGNLERAADRIGKNLAGTAQAEIGKYQKEAGPFPAWADLADSTEWNKMRHGYPVDAPLLASGELRDSYSYTVEAHYSGPFVENINVIVGSTDPVAVYHEFGTSRMPPRPVLGPAVFRRKNYIAGQVYRAMEWAFMNYGATWDISAKYDDPQTDVEYSPSGFYMRY